MRNEIAKTVRQLLNKNQSNLVKSGITTPRFYSTGGSIRLAVWQFDSPNIPFPWE